MANESRPSDRLILLEAKHVRVSERIKRLEEAIGELQSAPILRADAAARLVKYRQHYERLQYERATLEWELEASDGTLASDVGVRTLSDEMLERARKEKKKGWLRS
jgi:serine phosphatase RsbU (regulator of sigma subunit)